MLPATHRSDARLGGRAVLILIATASLLWSVPTFRGAEAQQPQGNATPNPQLPAQEHALQLNESPAELKSRLTADLKLRSAWDKLDEAQAARLARLHLQAIVVAMHAYAQHHELSLPPATVPNPNLPPEKRLSGLVLLLPYLGMKPDTLKPGDPWIDEEAFSASRNLAKKIDLNKAWDDPANRDAARTVVPMFLVPGGGGLRDKRGYAVSHFAFVRGANGEDNGAFPSDRTLKFFDILDGLSNTLAIGQIDDNLAPWIAGPFPSRFVYHPDDKGTQPSFGSQYGAGRAYFALVDGSVHFFDASDFERNTLHCLANRADRQVIHGNRIPIYRTAIEWKAAQQIRRGN